MARIRKTKHGWTALTLCNHMPNPESDAEIMIVGKKRNAYIWIGEKDGPCFATTRGNAATFLKAALEIATGKKVILR